MSGKTVRKLLGWTVLALCVCTVTPYVLLMGLLKLGELEARGQRPLHESIYTRTTQPHQLTLVDDGPTSFAKRIEIIDGARSTLELEFFIYELDLSSRLFTQKLIQKAREGVTVRLLVDFSFTVLELEPAYAEFLRQKNVEVRYYNTSPAYRLLASQHRSHRKLLIADDRIAMTGGRNISDDYFHVSERINFLDSDVVIEGPIVRKIRETFDLYWDSELTAVPSDRGFSEEEVANASSFVSTTQRDRDLLAFVEREAKALLARLQSHTCRDLTFVTDFPGAAEANRRIFQVLTGLFDEAHHEITGETPYFVIRAPSVKVLESLAARRVRVTVLTNSLVTTDAYYAVSALYGSIGDYDHTPLRLYVYDGTPAPSLIDLPVTRTPRWGVHSKRAVIDDRTIVIGTYNVDPRSAVLNSEILVVCRDAPALAAKMRADLEWRLEHAWPVLAAGKLDRDVLLRNSSRKERLRFYLALPLASALDFLL